MMPTLPTCHAMSWQLELLTLYQVYWWNHDDESNLRCHPHEHVSFKQLLQFRRTSPAAVNFLFKQQQQQKEKEKPSSSGLRVRDQGRAGQGIADSLGLNRSRKSHGPSNNSSSNRDGDGWAGEGS